jgi:transposase InsO family protein
MRSKDPQAILGPLQSSLHHDRGRRKRLGPDFKARVALQAAKGHKTASEIAQEFQVHPTQISQWKRQSLDNVPELFDQRQRDPAVHRAPRRSRRRFTRRSVGKTPENLALMRLMALQSIVPGLHTSRPDPEHAVYPYRLRGLAIEHSCHVWCADITYVPMRHGFTYPMAVLDWFSRYVVSWRLSNTLDTCFRVEALDAALDRGQPLIFNTDQGAQFTSTEWIERLKAWDILIRMDGRGRALDNGFVERLWRTLQYEDIYLLGYNS